MVAVSSSRISPTRITSGSCRMSERMPLPKSILAASLIEVCRIRVMGYSTGSSSVMMLRPSLLMWLSTEYSDGLNIMTLEDPVEYRSEEHTSELQSQSNLVCRLLLEKKKKKIERWGVCTYGR